MPTEQTRPDPDQLLAQVQAEELERLRGRLKIFLGYAAGVGKTYAMLEAGHQRHDEGVDVVVGYIETHSRRETEAMLEGLEIIPRKSVNYRGIQLPEMDVDALLKRQPQLAIIDELAHTNVPGSRHPKRYQDVQEILAAGIDVYTTLNVQHLESLNDVISQITGIVVHETVPDLVLDQAAEIELIDLPPDELLNRLQEGKVYIPEQAARAIQMFFRKGNLTALRELTMRRAAERVDDQMTDYMQTRSIPGPWPAAERLLVCISPSSFGERLVRATRRLADQMNADWLAVYVDSPDHLRLTPEKRDQIARTLRMAEALGAQSLILPLSSTAPTVAGTVVEYARQHNVTKIIAGKPLHPPWRNLLSGSIVDQLISRSGNIDIYVITSSPDKDFTTEASRWSPPGVWIRYLYSLLLVAGATLLGLLVGQGISPTNLVMLYLLAVVIAAVMLGRGPSVLTSILGVLAFDFFFVPPKFTFTVSDTEYLLTFGGLLLVGLVISYLTARAREQAEAAQRREADTSLLYALSRDLAAANDLDSVILAVVTHVEQAFVREAVIFLPDDNNQLSPYGSFSQSAADETETALAIWAFEHQEPAGRGTDTLPSANARYLPLKTSHRMVGVLKVRPREASQDLIPTQRRLLESFASQAALAIERVQLVEQSRQIDLLQATEKLQNALINSISHDLRTPLVSITGALTALEERKDKLSDQARQSLIETAREEAERLNRLVANLLDMTRLESGSLKVVSEPCDIQDVIGAALKQLEDRLFTRPVKLEVPVNFPLVSMDFVPIVHVLVNLIDNALKYSPDGSPLEIAARISDQEAQLFVMDRGVGIPPEDLERVFDKFYRVRRPEQVTGTGLGLAISKGIIEAHGGQIWASERPGGGTIITVVLPIQEQSSA